MFGAACDCRLRHWPRWLGTRLAVAAAILGAALQPTDSSASIDVDRTLDGERARAYLWRPVAVGAGGFITGLSSDREGKTRVARADVYGAYLWHEDEQRWSQLVNTASMPAATHAQNIVSDGVYEIAVAPTDPRRIYMALKNTVYRSDDRGTRFVDTRLPAGAGETPANDEFRHAGPYLAISPDDPNLVLFGTPHGGLWRSTDGGAHWAAVPSMPQSRDQQPAPGMQAPGIIVMYEPSPRSRVWAVAAGHGVFVSKDQGKTFERLPDRGGPAPTMLRQGTFAPDGSFYGVDADTRSAWRYRDGSWTSLVGPGRLPAERFAAVAVQPTTSQVFVFTEGGKPFRSADGGQSWSRLEHRAHISDGDPSYLRANDIGYWAMGQVSFDPVDGRRLWVAAGTGVYYTDLAGSTSLITWKSRLRGIEELVANDVVKPPGQSPLLAGWDFGIHLKDDLDAYSTTFGPKERMLISAQQLAWTPADPRFIVTNASDARTFCCSEDGDAVLAGFSVDGGRRWTRFRTLPHPPGTRADDPWRMSFGSIAVAANDIDNIVWLPTYHRAPYYTKDRGASWQRVVLPGEKLPLTGSHPALHYHRKTLAADRVLPGVFYLMHGGEGANAGLAGLWVTQDGGARWRRVFEGAIAPHPEHSAKLRVVPGQPGHLFFTSGTLGPFDTRLRRSIDGGAHWRALDGVDQVDDIAFGKPAADAAYPTIFVSARLRGGFGIWRSTDAASSWQRVATFPLGSLDQITVIEGDPDVFGRVYVGFKGSGWAYGQPASCEPAPFRAGASFDCSAIE
ncbi:conserved hypothetical protein [Burkholderiales bacterium 8X]|nr:conserved hypothetical protein [Burkholderiales bacterium 8X]